MKGAVKGRWDVLLHDAFSTMLVMTTGFISYQKSRTYYAIRVPIQAEKRFQFIPKVL